MEVLVTKIICLLKGALSLMGWAIPSGAGITVPVIRLVSLTRT
ncbi:hypothetical protein [Actinomyces sp. ZJ308]|nr:hypothetical protein [Actinomyces sp. ZJ308]